MNSHETSEPIWQLIAVLRILTAPFSLGNVRPAITGTLIRHLYGITELISI